MDNSRKRDTENVHSWFIKTLGNLAPFQGVQFTDKCVSILDFLNHAKFIFLGLIPRKKYQKYTSWLFRRLIRHQAIPCMDFGIITCNYIKFFTVPLIYWNSDLGILHYPSINISMVKSIVAIQYSFSVFKMNSSLKGKHVAHVAAFNSILIIDKKQQILTILQSKTLLQILRHFRFKIILTNKYIFE